MLFGLAQVLLKERVLLHMKPPCLEDGKQFRYSSLSNLGLKLLSHHHQGPLLQILLVYLLSIHNKVLFHFPLLYFLLDELLPRVEGHWEQLLELHLLESLDDSIEPAL